MKIKKTLKCQPHSKAELMTQALELIANSSYRLTRPRRILLDSILRQSKPFSALDLQKKLLQKTLKEADCDLVTIYRTLPMFSDLGILEKCDVIENVTYYQVKLGHTDHHHHHVICQSCKSIEALDLCLVEEQQEALKKLGYSKLSHRLDFFGLCPRCTA